jgi:hypothetical protein
MILGQVRSFLPRSSFWQTEYLISSSYCYTSASSIDHVTNLAIHVPTTSGIGRRRAFFGTVGDEISNEKTRNYLQYIEFLAGLMCVSFDKGNVPLTYRFFSVCETILQLILGRRQWFIDALGYIALGLESTLPLPQMAR